MDNPVKKNQCAYKTKNKGYLKQMSKSYNAHQRNRSNSRHILLPLHEWNRGTKNTPPPFYKLFISNPYACKYYNDAALFCYTSIVNNFFSSVKSIRHLKSLICLSFFKNSVLKLEITFSMEASILFSRS